MNDVGSMLNGFHKDHGKMSKELKNRLGKEVKDIEIYIDRRLKEFDEAHTEMTEQQRKDLAKFVSKIKSEVKKLLADCKDDIAGYRNEINAGSRAWKAMGATLAKGRRRGPMDLRVEAGGGRTTVKDAVEKKRARQRARGTSKRINEGQI
jgi:gas vesicle protein